MFSGKNKLKLRSVSTALGLAAVLWSSAVTADAQTTQSRFNDFQGNGRTSFTTVALPTGGSIRWKTTGNPASAAPNAAFRREFDYGLSTDSLTVGDYSGDAKSEIAVFRDTTASAPGFFYVSQFPTGTAGITLERAVRFGDGFSDIAGVQGDYDGDGKADYTVVRVNAAGTLVWYIMNSSTNAMKAISFGSTVGIPTPSGATVFPGADFNADGRDELIYVTRNAAGTQVNYFIGDANTGAGVITRTFGNFNTDTSLAPDDYTGDGRADFVAVRQTDGVQATWYIQNSQTAAVTATRFGIADPAFTDADLSVRGDFDGDNRHDICVWRPSNQTFYYISSLNGSIQAQKAGDETDTPLGSFGGY